MVDLFLVPALLNSHWPQVKIASLQQLALPFQPFAMPQVNQLSSTSVKAMCVFVWQLLNDSLAFATQSLWVQP
jgi:hypothetical protein